LFAHAVGLIDKRLFDNLDTIRDMRNEFAHFRDDITFSAQSVSDRCKNLLLAKLPRKEGKTHSDAPFSARQAFVATGLLLAGYFIVKTPKVHRLAAFDEAAFRAFMEKLASGLRDLIVAQAQAEKHGDGG
jgi:hypothetical protein